MFVDHTIYQEHCMRYGVTRLPGLAEIEGLFAHNLHDRIEPSITVRGGQVFPARFTAFFPLAARATISLWHDLRAEVCRAHGVKLDDGLEHMLEQHRLDVAHMEMGALGIDARPTLAEGRLKVGLGGGKPFPAEVAARLLARQARTPVPAGLCEHLWGVNVDFRFDGTSEMKLYFGFLPGDYGSAVLRGVLGDFDGHRQSDTVFVQLARGVMVADYTATGAQVRERIASIAGLELEDSRLYVLGASVADLSRPEPLTSFNLYTYLRRGETPSPSRASRGEA